MTAEETSKKEDRTKWEGSCPMAPGMLEMMGEWLRGEGASCSTMMKGMVEMMRSQSCCAPESKGTRPEEGKKEGADP